MSDNLPVGRIEHISDIGGDFTVTEEGIIFHASANDSDNELRALRREYAELSARHADLHEQHAKLHIALNAAIAMLEDSLPTSIVPMHISRVIDLLSEARRAASFSDNSPDEA